MPDTSQQLPGAAWRILAAAGAGGASAVYWVVPVLGAAAVWLTYLLGRRVAGAANGAAAAILTRPNLAPVASAVLVAVIARSCVRHNALLAALRAAMIFALPVATAVTFLLWLNIRLYGSPYQTGYGSTFELFAFGNVSVNASRDTRWLLDTQTPLVLIGLAAPLIAWIERRPGAAHRLSGPAWFGLGFVALVVACYPPYSSFEEWWYLRFLLPALPILLLLMVWVFMRLAADG